MIITDTRYATSRFAYYALSGALLQEHSATHNVLQQNQLFGLHRRELESFYSKLDLENGVEMAGVMFAPGYPRCVRESAAFFKRLAVPLVPLHFHDSWLIQKLYEAPFLGVVSSEKHMELIWVNKHHHYKLIGLNIDLSLTEGLELICQALRLDGLRALDAMAGNGRVDERFWLPSALVHHEFSTDVSVEGIWKMALRYIYPTTLRKFPNPLQPIVYRDSPELVPDLLYSVFAAVAQHLTQQIARTQATKVVLAGNFQDLPLLLSFI